MEGINRKGYARYRGNNRWQLEVDIGKKVGGGKRNKKYKTVHAKNEKEAQAKLAAFVEEIRKAGYFEPEEILFIDFINEKWVNFAFNELADTTFEGYVDCLENRIMPAFRYFKLHEIKQEHIIEFLQSLSKDGIRLDGKKGKLSSSQIVYHYRTLKHVINYALTIKYIKDNPFEGVPKPKEDYEEVEPYTMEEAQMLFDALEKEKEENLHWYIAIRLAVLNGMRRSEIYGLDLLKHIDIEQRIVRVRQALTYTKRKGYSITPIKKGSKRSKKRDIVLAESLVDPIEKLILAKKTERLTFKNEDLWSEGKHFLLLSHDNGKPFHPDSMRDWWIRFLKRHNLKFINIHGLRHTMVNLLIELETPLSTISKRAGHSGIGITNDIYGHRIQSLDEIATQKLDEALSRKNIADTLPT